MRWLGIGGPGEEEMLADSTDLQVADLMTIDPVTVALDATIWSASSARPTSSTWPPPRCAP